MKMLDTERMEIEIELGSAKLRYDIRKQEIEAREEEIEVETYGGEMKEFNNEGEEEVEITPFEKRFDYGKRRVTDLKENSRVVLP